MLRVTSFVVRGVEFGLIVDPDQAECEHSLVAFTGTYSKMPMVRCETCDCRGLYRGPVIVEKDEETAA